jgi:hypothetical protein
VTKKERNKHEGDEANKYDMQTTRKRIDDTLEEHGVTKSVYHSGAFEGNSYRTFMADSEAIVGSVRKVLMSIPKEDRAPECTDHE